MVATATEGVNVWGLVNNKGEELIPCETANIEVLSDRYLTVIYTTEVTENEEECFVYSTDSMVSFGVEEGDIMYKGYAKIYDLQQSRFVPDLTITYASGKIDTCGDNIFAMDKEETRYLYNSEGQVAYQTEDPITLGNGVFTIYLNNEYFVFDENGNKLFSNPNSINIIDGNGQYFYITENDKKYILDTTGRKVLEYPGNTISEINNDIIYGSDENNKNGLHKIDGTEIIPFSMDAYFYYMDNGYWCTTDDSYENYSLYNESGLIGTNLKVENSDYLIFRTSHEENAPLVSFNPEKTSIETKGTSVEVVSKGLVIDGADDDQGYYKCGVIDVFSGKVLIDYDYEEIKYESGYFYAYKDNAWVVFEVSK